MIKFLLTLLAKITNGLESVLLPYVSKEKLEEIKPIPLCWLYNRYDMVPPAFVGHNTAPSMTTGATTNLAQTSFTQEGNITSTNNANPTVRGFVYLQGSSGDPTLANTVVNESGSFGTGAYTLNITGLTANTSYRIRAYATNTFGTGYGDTITVTTEEDVVPTETVTHTIDTLVKAEQTATHTVDTLTRAEQTATHTVDTLVHVNLPPTVVLNTADESIFTDTTPTLEFTGTDPDGDDICYEIEISDSPFV